MTPSARHGGSALRRERHALVDTDRRVSRPHSDVDWFALIEDADILIDVLRQDGWAVVDRAPSDEQRDVVTGDLDLGIGLIRMDADRPVVAGGPFAGGPYPSTMITDAQHRRLHGVTADVISIESQIEIKKMMPTWVPHLRRRQKDLTDIENLERVLNR